MRQTGVMNREVGVKSNSRRSRRRPASSLVRVRAPGAADRGWIRNEDYETEKGFNFSIYNFKMPASKYSSNRKYTKRSFSSLS